MISIPIILNWEITVTFKYFKLKYRTSSTKMAIKYIKNSISGTSLLMSFGNVHFTRIGIDKNLQGFSIAILLVF